MCINLAGVRSEQLQSSRVVNSMGLGDFMSKSIRRSGVSFCHGVWCSVGGRSSTSVLKCNGVRDTRLPTFCGIPADPLWWARFENPALFFSRDVSTIRIHTVVELFAKSLVALPPPQAVHGYGNPQDQQRGTGNNAEGALAVCTNWGQVRVNCVCRQQEAWW